MGAHVPDGVGAVDEVVGEIGYVVVGLEDVVGVWVGTAGGLLDEEEEPVEGRHCE